MIIHKAIRPDQFNPFNLKPVFQYQHWARYYFQQLTRWEANVPTIQIYIFLDGGL